MFVDGVIQLREDVLQAVHHHVPLLLREVQGFAHLVGEERVTADIASERRSAQQVGMEQQGPAFGLIGLAVVLVADDLPRGQEHERSLLIVVVIASVAQVAAFHLFEVDRVKPVDLPFVTGRTALREVDDADQRVQRLDAARFVVLEDVVVFDDVAHIPDGFVRHKVITFFLVPNPFRAESVIMVRRPVIRVSSAVLPFPTFAEWKSLNP